MLRQLELETGVQGWAQGSEWLVSRRYSAVVKPHRQAGARGKSLQVREVAGGSVLGRSRTEGAARKDVETVFLHRAGQDWVKAGNVRSQAKSGTDQAIGSS